MNEHCCIFLDFLCESNGDILNFSICLHGISEPCVSNTCIYKRRDLDYKNVTDKHRDDVACDELQTIN